MEFDISLINQTQTKRKKEKGLTGIKDISSFSGNATLENSNNSKERNVRSSNYIKSFDSWFFYFLYDASQNKNVL